MVHGPSKVSHSGIRNGGSGTLTNRPAYAIMGGLAPTTGISTAQSRAYSASGSPPQLRQGMISGQPTGVVIPILRGGLGPGLPGLSMMCRHNLLSVNPQCSGVVGRRSFVCRASTRGRSTGQSSAGLRQCRGLIGAD